MLNFCAACYSPRHDPSGSGAPALARQGLPPPTPAALPDHGSEWSEEELVYLHWRLLQDVAHLADPAAPLAEKFDTLRWVFTEPHRDPLPFSFATCLQVVANSPLSPIGYCGAVDVEDVRDRLRGQLRRWLDRSLDAYPAWVGQLVRDQLTWVAERLDKNPQWLNEQVRAITQQGDLYN